MVYTLPESSTATPEDTLFAEPPQTYEPQFESLPAVVSQAPADEPHPTTTNTQIAVSLNKTRNTPTT